MKTQKLKSLLSAKNIADIAFMLAALIYLGLSSVAVVAGEKIGFFAILAVILYGGLSVVVLRVISLIARGFSL